MNLVLDLNWDTPVFFNLKSDYMPLTYYLVYLDRQIAQLYRLQDYRAAQFIDY